MLVVAMYVAPEHRRAGCAHRLLDRIAEVARDQGGRRLLLDVTDLESAAGRCYARYGFTETGSRRPMDRDPSLDRDPARVRLVVLMASAVGGRA